MKNVLTRKGPDGAVRSYDLEPIQEAAIRFVHAKACGVFHTEMDRQSCEDAYRTEAAFLVAHLMPSISQVFKER